MALLRPYIYCDNAREQAAFYVDALGGEIVSVKTFGDMPGAEERQKDRVMHLIMQAAGVQFYLADSSPIQRGNGLDLTLEFASDHEAAQAFKKLAAGGKVVMKFERMFWGSMFGRLEDKFGVSWQIATELRN